MTWKIFMTCRKQIRLQKRIYSIALEFAKWIFEWKDMDSLSLMPSIEYQVNIWRINKGTIGIFMEKMVWGRKDACTPHHYHYQTLLLTWLRGPWLLRLRKTQASLALTGAGAGPEPGGKEPVRHLVPAYFFFCPSISPPHPPCCGLRGGLFYLLAWLLNTIPWVWLDIITMTTAI